MLEIYEPSRVFHYFEEICAIPHPSYHEKQISDYIVNFAKEHNIQYWQDDLYNVIMIKEASEGYEDVEPVIIQGHMDMVAEQDSDCKKDMLKEGLDLQVIDGFISAKGTTLGGDDGVAVAMALAILEDDTIKHPRIEVIITVSEEVGMEGAAGIDVSMLKGHKMLNLDSEEEGIFLAGCAGGCRLDLTATMNQVEATGVKITIEIDNCTGGHSGSEIDKMRANASMLIIRLLSKAVLLSDGGIKLAYFMGGTKDNAITRSAKAIFFVDENISDKLIDEAENIIDEYSVSDPDMELNITDETGKCGLAADETTSANFISMAASCPKGVQRMSLDTLGLVETSLNLGVTAFDMEEAAEAKLSYCIRSSVESAKNALIEKIALIGKVHGAQVGIHGSYPAWQFKRQSQFRDTMVEIYEDMFGVRPQVMTLHAGLECGLLSEKIKDLDAVSLGPELYDIHTPKERLSIASTKRMYDYVLKVLEHK